MQYQYRQAHSNIQKLNKTIFDAFYPCRRTAQSMSYEERKTTSNRFKMPPSYKTTAQMHRIDSIYRQNVLETQTTNTYNSTVCILDSIRLIRRWRR